MRTGLEIKNGWGNLENSSQIFDPILFEDITTLRNELYSNLKEYFSLPKLRKENHHVENDLNTVLQTHLYDFLYDQQDLYDEYSEMIMNKNYKESLINVRRKDLPFANCLENFVSVLKEFQNDGEAGRLAKLRWYLCFGDNSSSNSDFLHNFNNSSSGR
jgi:hypothetical protein